MQSITRVLLQLLTALSLVAFLAAWLAPTASAHVTTPNNGPYGSGHYDIMHIGNVGNVTYDEYGMFIAPGTGANITQSWSVSNSFSATIQISKDIVSAQLGYNVTQTTDISQICSANNTTGQDQLLEWESVFTNYTYDIYWYSNLTGNDTFQGTGRAQEYNYPRCALY